MDRLIEAKIKLISACNYRCQMCDHWSTPTVRLSTEEVLGAVRDAAALGAEAVIFSGGEPTLHEGLEEAVAEASGLGLRVTIATNGGALLPGRLEALLRAGVTQLNVSLDGPDPESHDTIRGVPGSFAKIVTGLGRAAAANVPVGLKTVVARTSFRRLAAMPPLADLVPLRSLALTLLSAYEPEQLPLRLGREDLEVYFFTILPEVIDAAAGRQLRLKLYPIFRELRGLKRHRLARALREAAPAHFAAELDAFAQGRFGAAYAGRNRCPVVPEKTLIRPDGSIHFCCEVSHAGDLRMGGIRDPGGLAAAWHSPTYAASRAARAVPAHRACDSCTEWFGYDVPEVGEAPASGDQAGARATPGGLGAPIPAGGQLIHLVAKAGRG